MPQLFENSMPPLHHGYPLCLQKNWHMEERATIEQAWQNRTLVTEPSVQEAIREVIAQVDKGLLRVATPTADGWQVQEWVKQAILLYFSIQPMQTWNAEPFEFYDKMLLKKGYKELGVRAVPHAIAR